MSVRYDNPSVSVDAEQRTLRAGFTIRGGGRDEEAGAVHLGWQLYDPETGLFIAEGDWKGLARAANESGSEQSVELELPREKGRYHVYISLRDAERGWFFALGRPFLLIDAAVEQGRARLLGFRTTTLRGMKWRRRLKALPGLFTSPVRTVWANGGLIRSMVGRDIAARYRGSFGDALWTVLNPLLLMITYYFVFGIVLRARFPGDPSREGFALYFLAGMLPWLPFSEAAGRAPVVVLEYRNFVKKLRFPVETLPVNLTISGLVTQAFALGVFMVFLLISKGSVPVTALWLPLLVIPQLLFTAGIAWFLAALGVYVRDLGQVIGYLLTLWFFLTPICYPEESLPAAALPVLQANPIFILVRGFRDCLLEPQAPAFGPLWKLWVVSIVVCLLGHAWFYKLRKSFADVI